MQPGHGPRAAAALARRRLDDPLQEGQLDVGEFEYDAGLPALRASVYGLDSGAVDVLTTPQNTYVLEGPHRAPTGCIALGPKLRPPSAQWLRCDAICAGEAPLGKEALQWWQQPGFDVARYCFTAKSRLPWRSLFVTRSLDPAVIGDYAMTYFPSFSALPETNLAALQKLCETTATPTTAELGETPTARELMAIANDAAAAEREDRIAELIPGLSVKACARMTLVQWPDRFVTTALVTPIKIEDVPYSTMIYYDWSGEHTLLVLPFHGYPPTLQGILSLKERVGYRLHFSDAVKRTGICRRDLPGAVKPDWMKQAGCKCKGVLGRGSALSPDAETQILSCPIKNQTPRIMWTWYTTASQPIMFMEAAPTSGGVMLADYYDCCPATAARPATSNYPRHASRCLRTAARRPEMPHRTSPA